MTANTGVNTGANPYRGEAIVTVAGKDYLLRPSFAALVAAEEELGALFALVERAGKGQLKLTELAERDAVSRSDLEHAIITIGLSGCAVPLRIILTQILKGSG